MRFLLYKFHYKMTQLVPLEDHVLVAAISEDATSSMWLILPDNDKEKPSRGRVVAVGAWKIMDNGQRAPMDVQVDDIVHFTKYSPDEIEVGTWDDKQKYLVIRHSSILAIEK